MNIFCRWYQERLLAYSAQALPEHQARRVESHLTHCPACRAELAVSHRFGETLRNAAPGASAPNPYLWERLEAEIQAGAAPKTQGVRRLAPLAAMAFSGVALAAVGVQYRAHTAPIPASAPQAAARTSSVETLPTAPPVKSLPVANNARPAAVRVAQQTERLRPPTVISDPFVVNATPPVVASLPVHRAFRHRGKRQELRNKAGALAPDQAVALVELGTRRVVQEVHTAQLNRMVVESELGENQEKTRRAACAPTEATQIAQQTRSLFQ